MRSTSSSATVKAPCRSTARRWQRPAAREPATTATHLCRRQVEEFQRVAGIAGQAGETLLVACTQEAPLFLETLDEMDTPPAIAFTNIREKAGWSDAAKDKKSSINMTAKMAALLNEAAMDLAGAHSVSMKSSGVTLVLGKGEDAVEAARKLAGRLNVTLVLEGTKDVPPPAVMEFPVFAGKVTGAGGHLGAFQVAIAGFIPAKASSRGALEWEGEPQSGTSECDLILDLRGGPALFPHADKRDGYYNPDRGNPALVAEAIFEMADMVGEFEKPRYVDYDVRAASTTARPAPSPPITSGSRSTPTCAAAAGSAPQSARPARRPMPCRSATNCSSARARCCAPMPRPAARTRCC